MTLRTAPAICALLLALPALFACSSNSGDKEKTDENKAIPLQAQYGAPNRAETAEAGSVVKQAATQKSERPDTKTAEPSTPVPSVTWFCLCYMHKTGGGGREVMTACRPSAEACEKLESKTAKGGRTVIAGSLSRACREIGATDHPADVLGERDSWSASSKPGSYILAGLCPLKMLPGDPMSADSFATAIGPLELGIPGNAVIEALGPPESKGKAEISQATGNMLQTWSYEGQGLMLTMALDDDNVVLWDVLVRAPSTLKTRHGVGIGTSFKKARTIYSGALAPKDEQFDRNVLIVGSIYGGLFLTKKKGVVSEMFLGAGAE